MGILKFLFSILALATSVYSMFCLARIILTWIPSVGSSKIVNFLANICDPFLNMFRGFRFLHLGSIDFSPALGLCVLGMLNQIFSMMSRVVIITVGFILSIVLNSLASVVNSFIFFFFIILIVRLVIIFIKNGSSFTDNYFFAAIDQGISSFVFRCAELFGKRNYDYKTAIMIFLAELFIASILFNVIVRIVDHFILLLPF